MINKHMPIISSEAGAPSAPGVSIMQGSRNVEYKDVSVTYRTATPSYAESVLLTYNEDDAHLIKIRLRQTRLELKQ